MLKFETYITEMAAASSSEASDDKGKLHELLLAKYLHPKGTLPQHHRSESDEYGGTPQQVHDRLKTKMNPAAYSEIDSHARQTAASVMDHLRKSGYEDHDISDVHWTSNRDTVKKAGDHEKTTGIRDPNSNADLILTTKHKKTGKIQHVGVSAKYGTEEQPNYRNDGLASLEQKAKLKSGTLTDIQKNLHKDIEDKVGYTGTIAQKHEQYKVGRDAKANERKEWKAIHGSNKGFMPKGEESNRARAAEDMSVEARKKMARHLDKGFGSFSDEDLREYIRGQVSPETKIHHIVAHSHVQDDGSAISKVGDMHNLADEHLNNFKNIRVKKGTGIYTQFVGDYNGKERPVAQQILKTGSGPVKGSAGSFKLVSIPKKILTQKMQPNKLETAEPSKPKKVKSFKQVTAPKPVSPETVKPINRGEFGQHRGEGPDIGLAKHASHEVGGIPFYSNREQR